MSTPEQDAVIGRTLREHKDAKKALAALHAEAERIGNDLTGVGHSLRSTHSLGTVAGYPGFNPATFPTVDQLSALADEIKTTKSNKDRLAQILRDAGHQLAD